MSKVKIGFDFDSERMDQANSKKRSNLLKTIQQFFELYDLEIDKDSSDFVESFKQKFELKHRSLFPSFIPLESILTLSNVDQDEITNLENNFRTTYKVQGNKDYNVYAVSERELRAYDLAVNCLALVDSFEALYGPLNAKRFNELSILFKGIITTDKRSSERAINPNRIKSV